MLRVRLAAVRNGHRIAAQRGDRVTNLRRHGKPSRRQDADSVRSAMPEEVGMGRRAQPALHDYTGYLLRRAYVKANGILNDCMPDDSRAREAAVLSIIDERGALSQRELGDVTHVNRTLIVKLV